MQFQLKNSNKFVMLPQPRLHIATVQYGTRTFICFEDKVNGNTYIEEDCGGSDTQFVKDHTLHFALAMFIKDCGLLGEPSLSDRQWKPLSGKKYFETKTGSE